MIKLLCHYFLLTIGGRIMAFFDRKIECMDGKMKQVRVLGNQGASDRAIRVNQSASGFVLGNENDHIYNAARTKKVSTASIPSFAKQNLK
jgi:hypothetical protein